MRRRNARHAHAAPPGPPQGRGHGADELPVGLLRDEELDLLGHSGGVGKARVPGKGEIAVLFVIEKMVVRVVREGCTWACTHASLITLEGLYWGLYGRLCKFEK